ncbi:unnamed protein product [Soboliphyme baturini]|uniref:Uncharacterized protein n=1 Tax=Soboliphyme baturini TaxID=241478 RepID=A0A183J044_9BILA|nr:unnamed protein product [Soboliphyme baturini]
MLSERPTRANVQRSKGGISCINTYGVSFFSLDVVAVGRPDQQEDVPAVVRVGGYLRAFRCTPTICLVASLSSLTAVATWRRSRQSSFVE